MHLTVTVAVLLVLLHLGAAQPPPIFLPPSITMVEPEYIIKGPLAKAKLVCRATGVPKPQMTWYRNDRIVGNSAGVTTSSDGTLSMTVMKTVKGRYQCKAENNFGLAQSNITEVDMAELQDYEATPQVLQPTVVNEGEFLKLDCKYSDPFSNPSPSWSWVNQDTIEGTNPVQTIISLDGRLSVDDRGNLYFQHVMPVDNQDGGYHLCQAWNPILNVKKIGSPHQLRINPGVPANMPPTLAYQNGDNGKIEVIEDDPIHMYCIFKGYPTVNVIWEKVGNTPKPLMSYRNGKTKVIIEKSKNTNQYEGRYKCTGWQNGKADRVNGFFEVSVLQKPRFIEGPVDTNVTEKGEVRFTCRAQAETVATIEWFVNGEPLADLPFDARRTVEGDTFRMKNLRRGNGPQDSDLQVVTCMASNKRDDGTEVGRSYMQGYINVLLEMKYKTPPENFTISDSSQNVILDCEIRSDPSKIPHISWHRNQAPIFLKEEKYQIAPNGSLIIFTRNFDDLDDVEGQYLCVGETRAPAQRLRAEAWVSVKEGVVPIPVTSASISLWWIGLLLVLIIIVLIVVLICCLMKRGKGESYPVDEVERMMGNDPEKDLKDQGFHDYRRQEKRNPISGSRETLDCSFAEDEDFPVDDGSMFGDLDAGNFNEDGSFIGQYAESQA